MRVIFDTNIWRLLVDTDSGKALQQLCRRRKLSVMIPPATGLEMARTPRMETRQKLLAAVCRAEWKRLMPEAYTESREMRSGKRRHHGHVGQERFQSEDRLEAFACRHDIIDQAKAHGVA